MRMGLRGTPLGGKMTLLNFIIIIIISPLSPLYSSNTYSLPFSSI